jgi:hypothetical protein
VNFEQHLTEVVDSLCTRPVQGAHLKETQNGHMKEDWLLTAETFHC